MREVTQIQTVAPRAYLTLAKSEVHPLSRLPDRELGLIARIGQVRQYAKGMVIAEQGEPASGLYINHSALLRLSHVQADGKTTAVSLLGPGRMLGLAEIILGTRHQRRCEVVTAGRLEYLPKREMAHLILEHTAIAVEMLIQASQQILDQTADMCRIPSSSSEERLLHSLEDFSATGKRAGRETPLLTVQELADSIGCSRQWTSKILGEMESRGVIQRDGRRIVLTPRASLSPISPILPIPLKALRARSALADLSIS